MKIIKANQHSVHHDIADASCFYFPSLEIDDLVSELSKNRIAIMALPGRIEVSDKDGPLHFHNGATIVFITSGYGMMKTEEGDEAISSGDIIIVPPRTKHLSIAAKGTTMIEHIVFIGAKGDLQATLTD